MKTLKPKDRRDVMWYAFKTLLFYWFPVTRFFFVFVSTIPAIAITLLQEEHPVASVFKFGWIVLNLSILIIFVILKPEPKIEHPYHYIQPIERRKKQR